MFVQRLPRWIRRLVASLFHPHSSDPLSPERTAVLSATLRGDTGTHSGPDAGRGASWLDDGRRLRPRPSPPAKLDQRWNARSATPAPGRQRIPTQPQPGRAPSLRPPAEQRAPEPPRARPAEPAASREQPVPPAVPSLPVRSNDGALSAFGSSSPTDGQQDYRRLMALKRLVRLGIYNEGFDPNRVPEQYDHSLGREENLDSGEGAAE